MKKRVKSKNDWSRWGRVELTGKGVRLGWTKVREARMPLWSLYVLLIFTFLGSYLRWIPSMAGLGLMAFIMLVGSVWFFWGFFRLSVLSHSDAQKILLTQFVFPAGLFWMILMAVGFPVINDVSTDTESPPSFSHIDRPSEYSDETARIVKENYPKVQPLILPHSASQVFDETVALIKTFPDWNVVHSALESGTIEASQETLVFGFIDDVSIRIRAVGDGKTRLDMRSKSRLGRNDFGANAKRILMFHEGLTKRLQK